MKTLICGGRDFKDQEHFDAVMDKLLPVITGICHGGARGADRMAGEWARKHNIPCRVFHADWDAFGKRAGYIRNQMMLDVYRPDMVIAFPGGTGTAHMVRLSKYAQEAGLCCKHIIDQNEA